MEELELLIQRACSGDLDAYGRIVRAFQDMAYGCAYSVLGDFHLAQDAAQEAFVEAYRKLGDLRAPAAFPAWFRRVVVKHCDRLTRRKVISTVPLDAVPEMSSNGITPADAAEKEEMKNMVLEAIRRLPESERMVTTLFYINGYSQKEVADFLEVPVTTVNNRLHASRKRLTERMMAMVDRTLKDASLPDDFADVVVRMVASDADLKRAVELMPSGTFESVADAQKKEIFVVGKEGQVESAGHLGTTSLAIGSTALKAARSGYGIAGESEGVPDPMFVKGYRAHFKLAKQSGCSMIAVHGSQYDHGFCGLVPCFYYPLVSLPCERAKSIVTEATIAEANDGQRRAGEQALALDPFNPKMSAYIGGRAIHVVEQGGKVAGYAWVNDGFVPADHYNMPFGHVTDVTVRTRDAALAVIRRAGELAEKGGDTDVWMMQSHMTLITQAMLSLGGTYLLRPSCDLVGLDAEMVAIVDLALLTRELQGEFQSRLNAAPAGCSDGRLSIEMGGTTVGFIVRSGQVSIVAEKQKVHRILPRWVVTRLYMGYYSGEDILCMGGLPYDRSDGKSPDDVELDMKELRLPEKESAVFKALFPKLWPCATPDPEVWPWVIGKAHPAYQHEEDKTADMKAQIDGLRFPWIGY